MSDSRIEILDAGIRIRDLEIPKQDIADYLRAIPEPEREAALSRAIEVGIFCLERARVGQDLDFVRQQITLLLTNVEIAVGRIPDETQKQLAQKIGTAEGQVLAPVQTLVSEVSRAAKEKIEEVRKLLEQEIDPSKDTSVIGKSLKALRDLLDPKRSDSIQGSLDTAISMVTREDGPLAKAVKAVVAEAVKPLADRVDALSSVVTGQDAAAEALAQTTEKGSTYEDDVVLALQTWGQSIGAEVHHVGSDNQPGDTLVLVDETRSGGVKLIIVVEVRDRQNPLGRKAISEALSEAMSRRGASAAIYVSRGREGLAREIGEWAEGAVTKGPWIACTHEHLITAIRFLLVQERIRTLRAAMPEVDASSIETQLQTVRTTLSRVTTISKKVTDVRASAQGIQDEAECIRTEIRAALAEIEETLRRGGNSTNGLRDSAA